MLEIVDLIIRIRFFEDLEPLASAEKRLKLDDNGNIHLFHKLKKFYFDLFLDSPKLDLEALVSKFIYSLRNTHIYASKIVCAIFFRGYTFL